MFKFFGIVFVVTFAVLYSYEHYIKEPQQLNAAASIEQSADSSRLAVTELTAGEVTVIHSSPAISPSRYRPDYKAPADQYTELSISSLFSSRQYYRYVGEQSDPTEAKAVVVLLHGSNRTGASMIDTWKHVADANNLVLIAPNSSSSNGWSPKSYVADANNLVLIAPNSSSSNGWSPKSDPLSLLQSIIDETDKEISIDRDNIFLFGHSAGGVFSTYLINDASHPFKAVATHAGFLAPTNLAEIGQDTKGATPMALFLGDQDHLFKVDDAHLVAEIFTKQGRDVRVEIIKGHNHWYYTLGPSLNYDIWDFFEQ